MSHKNSYDDVFLIISSPTYSRQVDMRKEMLPTPALTTPIVNTAPMEAHQTPKSLELVSVSVLLILL